jgi:hypothetical protein
MINRVVAALLLVTTVAQADGNPSTHADNFPAVGATSIVGGALARIGAAGDPLHYATEQVLVTRPGNPDALRRLEAPASMN